MYKDSLFYIPNPLIVTHSFNNVNTRWLVYNLTSLTNPTFRFVSVVLAGMCKFFNFHSYPVCVGV